MTDSSSETPLSRIWADMVAAGWREPILRFISHALLLGLVLLALSGSRIAWPTLDGLALNALALNAATAEPAAQATFAAVGLSAPGNDSGSPPAFGPLVSEATHLSRAVSPRTTIATQGRVEVITYTVQPGDTLFGIAARFNLKPETLLWGNYFTLKDDPHTLRPAQVLNILPVDGTYHFVTEGNTIEQIASFYRVTPETILNWEGNDLDPAQPVLRPNTYLVIPGGARELQAWVLPSLPRTAKASARANSNFGQCPGGYTGILGNGSFVWPTQARTLSGYDYSGIHRGIDIRASLGDPIVAVDNGVVTYAGWNDWGYGNLVVIDHGTGWESVYAHLSQWNVQCGQSVSQGELIGAAGSTGRSSAPHLHFELRFNTAFVNPWTVLP
jgi:murein DD-endopeptidase MepM/ murein hydrolase activator NlpD